MHPLEPYVLAWKGTAGDVVELLPTLSDGDWATPTDCPGWTVHDVAAHVAHLESVLAGIDTDQPLERSGDKAGGGQVARDYTEAGVAARRDRSPADLIDEIEHAVTARTAQLAELPDPDSSPSTTPGGVRWSWETLLRNRAVDFWVHEQDIRRAVDRPGSLDTGGAQVAAHTFAAGMPFVLGKRVAPAPGTSVVWTITGGVPLEIGAVIGDDGRAEPTVVDDPATRLTLTSDAFCVLAAGRRGPDAVEVDIVGDEQLGQAVLGSMALTT